MEKHAVITGGAKGIGLGCAEIFIREGWRVSILDLDVEEGKMLEDRSDQFGFHRCDVSKESEVIVAMQSAIARFGAIDSLVCNAGIQRYSTVTETSEEEWDLVMNVNLKGGFLCAKHALPSMQEKGSGTVILMSSVQAFVTQEKVAPYATSKTAMLGLARSIAIDYAPHIRCVAVCPGTVDTPLLRNAFALSPDPEAVLQECNDMHLRKRIGTPKEIGELVYFLCSDRAGFISGQAIRIDGGLGTMIGGSRRE